MICLGGDAQGHALFESMVERSDAVTVIDGAQAATDLPRTEADHQNRRAVAAELALLNVERYACTIQPVLLLLARVPPGHHGMGSRR